MIHLLDANVLIALLDTDHVFHARAHGWFGRNCGGGWASCPLTQNAVLRILGHPRYPSGPGDPAGAAVLLGSLLDRPEHVFWPDAIALLSTSHVRIAAITSPSEVTDTYLLALAVHRGGKLASFDRRMSVAAVTGGAEALAVIA